MSLLFVIMEENLFSFKDLYSVYLKATYPIEIGPKSFETGETILKFDHVQLAGLRNLVDYVAARGGWDNRAHVWWETTKEEHFTLAQGVFSKEHFAMLYNSKAFEEQEIIITNTELLESDENKHITLAHTPIQYFCYDLQGNRLSSSIDGNVITVDDAYTDARVDYTYSYENKTYKIQVGNQLINGYLSLEGRTRVKDDTTGQVVTGIIKIPKLKLMSDLSITLGAQANPVVANLSAVGVPVGERRNSYVMEYAFLSNDIDSDM